MVIKALLSQIFHQVPYVTENPSLRPVVHGGTRALVMKLSRVSSFTNKTAIILEFEWSYIQLGGS